MPYRSTGAATAYNILHFFDIGGDFDQGTMDGLVNDWADAINPILNANWEVGGTTRCLDLSTDPPGEIFAAGTADDGGVSGPALPPACCACVSLSAGASRRRRGRIYLPGMTESQWSDDGLAGSGVAPAIAAAVQSAATVIPSEHGWALAVYSRLDGVARVVQTLSVDGVLDTQRRRQARLAP